MVQAKNLGLYVAISFNSPFAKNVSDRHKWLSRHCFLLSLKSFYRCFCPSYSTVAHTALSSLHGEYPEFSALFCPQVPMVELVCGVPSHASCHDRPPGYVGGPLAPGWPCPGPGHRGFPAAHRHLHPDGRPARGHNPAHQAGECCRASPRLHHPHTDII